MLNVMVDVVNIHDYANFGQNHLFVLKLMSGNEILKSIMGSNCETKINKNGHLTIQSKMLLKPMHLHNLAKIHIFILSENGILASFNELTKMDA